MTTDTYNHTTRNPLDFTQAQQVAVDIAMIRTGISDPQVRLILGPELCGKWADDLAELERGI